MQHFAANGYEGASLADIAGDVGIKKQSIYTHFAGKDELFLAVYRDSLDKECQFVRHHFRNEAKLSAEQLLRAFLERYYDRYEEHEITKFFMRTIFFPPHHLEKVVMETCSDFVDGLESSLVPAINEGIAAGEIDGKLPGETVVAAYAAVVDALLVELLYGGAERASKRLEATWQVYWKGIRA